MTSASGSNKVKVYRTCGVSDVSVTTGSVLCLSSKGSCLFKRCVGNPFCAVDNNRFCSANLWRLSVSPSGVSRTTPGHLDAVFAMLPLLSSLPNWYKYRPRGLTMANVQIPMLDF